MGKETKYQFLRVSGNAFIIVTDAVLRNRIVSNFSRTFCTEEKERNPNITVDPLLI